MSNKKYSPVWTDGLTYDEQHLVSWISNNYERVDNRYSFLPIRMLGDFSCERKKFDYIHLICDYFEKGNVRVSGKVVPIEYYVAEKAFDSAAKEFFMRHPKVLNVTFNILNYNGVYDCEFGIDYKTRLVLFQEILDKNIDKFCIVDEKFEFKKRKQEHYSIWPEYSIKARLDIREEELPYNFPEILSSYGYPYIPKKQVKVKKEDVYKYYYTIPEKIFVLGNQYNKYNSNSDELLDFFKAAKNRDMTSIEKYISLGVDINAIDSDGNTVFGKYIGSPFDYKKHDLKKRNIDDLKKLISLGANPGIYGVGTNGGPLSAACLDENFDVIALMLKNGVNPHLYPCVDEPSEDMSETLLERTTRWAEGDVNINLIPSEAQQTILKMLQDYV